METHQQPPMCPGLLVRSRAPGALASRKCKYDKYNGKGKISEGSAQRSTARPQETRFLPGKPSSPRFHSEDVDPVLARGERQRELWDRPRRQLAHGHTSLQ